MHNLAKGSIDDVEFSGALWRGCKARMESPVAATTVRDEKKEGAEPLAEGEALQWAKNSFPGEYFIPTFAEVQQQERKNGKKREESLPE